MRKIDYPKLYLWTCEHKRMLRVMRNLHLPAVLFVVLSYAAYIGFSAYLGSIPRALTAIATSAVPFVAVSILRRVLGGERPYEVHDLGSLGIELPRHGGGRSFPSRHSFSAFLVGTLMLLDVPYLGAAVLLVGVFISVYRTLAGLHFVRDVLVGAVIGTVTGICGSLCIYFFT